MSYDLYLHDPVTDKLLEVDVKHHIRGGTYRMGGDTRLSLNITFNYGTHYYRVFGETGLRSIYGMSGAESIPVLKEAISKLGDDVDSDYWKSTEGNAKQALFGLLGLAQMRPDGVWKGD
jgi:hypothetical protein